jgi:hypothetical protein
MNMILNRQDAKVAKKGFFNLKTWRSWRLGG